MVAKRGAVLFATLLLVMTAACNRAAVKTPAPVETTAAPSPSPTPDSFELEGVVVEASGSAGGKPSGGASSQSPSQGAASTAPSAGASASASASPGAGASSSTSSGSAQPEMFQNASPGSIALRLTSFNSAAGACVFSAGDTLVIAYTGTTTFEPAETTDNNKFPNSIQGSTVGAKGDVVDSEQGCLLVARSVNVVTQASPSPAPKKSAKAAPRPTSKASASPTPSRSPSSSPSASSSASSSASPSP